LTQKEIEYIDDNSFNTLNLNSILGDKTIIEQARECGMCIEELDSKMAVEFPEKHRVSTLVTCMHQVHCECLVNMISSNPENG
jgi:hypothetical protein